MKKYMDELFEVHKNKTFDQFLLDELNYHLARVERNWVLLQGDEDDEEPLEWEDYRLLLEHLSRDLNVAINFIERTEGPDIVPILYGEILNHVDGKLTSEVRVPDKDYIQIQYILAALGTCLNPEILELGVIEEGQLNNYLTERFLAAIEQFGQ